MTLTDTAPDVDAALAEHADDLRLAHLPCAFGLPEPGVPGHAVCGYLLTGVVAPPDAPRCPECAERYETAGGPLAAMLGLIRCNDHRAGTR